jgi:inorganic pyrophosphatase
MPPAFSAKDNINAIIETPRGSRNKYIFDPETSLFSLKKILPPGLCFPLDFGFIPKTKAEDGDPMDVLIFMEEPGFAGCLVECRVIGIITAEQIKNKKRIRNDRVLGVDLQSRAYAMVKDASDVDKEFLKDVTRFFEFYHEKEGDKFKAIKIANAGTAVRLIRKNLIP